MIVYATHYRHPRASYAITLCGYPVDAYDPATSDVARVTCSVCLQRLAAMVVEALGP